MQAVWVVVVVLVAHAVYLARSLSQTRVRLLSLERFARVPVGIDDLESKRAADLERLAAVEQAQAQAQAPAPAPAAAPAVSGTEPDDDDACTKVWTGPPAALVEAAARGSNPPSEATPRAVFSMDVAPRAAASPPPISSAAPQATPRAFLSMNVAPRAVALVPPLSRVAQLAAGLERPKSTRGPPHAPPVRVRTETLAGMASPFPRATSEGDASEERPSWPSLKQRGSAASTRPPAGPAPVVAIPRFPQTLLSMQAQSTPQHEAPTRRDVVAVDARPSNAQSDATTVLAPPPMYARHRTMRPAAPLAHPDLIGSEDIADEVARLSLGPDELTPPRLRRAKDQP